jgi:CRP-like cAMP-binding protein
MAATRHATSNILIQSMAQEDYDHFESYFESVSLERGKLLVEPDQAASHIYFPEGGICSVVTDLPGIPQTEVGIFGREGMSSFDAILGSGCSSLKTFIQIEGDEGLRIEFDRFRDRMDESPSLRRLTENFTHTMTTQMTHTSVSYAHYRMEARLARWLLMCHDRLESDAMKLTHDFISVMIGAQRTTVTVTLHILEGIGAIRSERGVVTIIDRDKLRDLAGAAYGKPEAEYRRLIGEFGS